MTHSAVDDFSVENFIGASACANQAALAISNVFLQKIFQNKRQRLVDVFHKQSNA
jgi:hypothetical protein